MQPTAALRSLAVVVTVLLASPALLAAPADEAAAAFANGQALLARADFDGALVAFKVAATQETGNADYTQQYILLRQIVQMRAGCREEANTERWLTYTAALRAFYYDHHLYAEALPLDRQRYQRAYSADSAALLAETHLALDMNTEALQVLSDLPAEQRSPWRQVLQGLALARLGRIEEASRLAEQLPDVQQASADYYYDLARLQASVGNAKGAMAALTRAFETTPPSRIEHLKGHAKECREFGKLAAGSNFSGVLNTPSKIKESKCSRGAGCGKCPKAAKCGKHAATVKKDS